MTNERFQEILRQFQEHQSRTLEVKGKEYSGSKRYQNKLHNFYRMAEAGRKSPGEALEGVALKQFVSVQDMIRDMADGEKFSRAYVMEKMGDLCNYFGPLLLAVMEEEDAICDPSTTPDTGNPVFGE